MIQFNSKIKAFAALLLIIGCLQVAADVSLNTTVKKVESYIGEDGLRKTRLINADKVVPGDQLKYLIEYANTGTETVDGGSIVITDPIPQDTVYLSGSAFGSGTQISFSANGGNAFAEEGVLTINRDGVASLASAEDYTTIQWKFGPALEPGQKGHVSFDVVLK